MDSGETGFTEIVSFHLLTSVGFAFELSLFFIAELQAGPLALPNESSIREKKKRLEDTIERMLGFYVSSIGVFSAMNCVDVLEATWVHVGNECSCYFVRFKSLKTGLGQCGVLRVDPESDSTSCD